MQIPKELLAESNYSGTRLIEIQDDTVKALNDELAALKAPAEPHLAKLEELGKILDPHYMRIGQLHDEIKKIKEEIEPTKALFDAEVAELDKIHQQSVLIKNKMQPVIDALIAGQLGEFEKPIEVTKKGEKFYVEVQDELEEKIKQIRANNARKATPKNE